MLSAEKSGAARLPPLTPRLAAALCRQNQATPLYIVAQKSHVEAARLLVEAKADVDARNKVSTQPRSRRHWLDRYAGQAEWGAREGRTEAAGADERVGA